MKILQWYWETDKTGGRGPDKWRNSAGTTLHVLLYYSSGNICACMYTCIYLCVYACFVSCLLYQNTPKEISHSCVTLPILNLDARTFWHCVNSPISWLKELEEIIRIPHVYGSFFVYEVIPVLY